MDLPTRSAGLFQRHRDPDQEWLETFVGSCCRPWGDQLDEISYRIRHWTGRVR